MLLTAGTPNRARTDDGRLPCRRLLVAVNVLWVKFKLPTQGGRGHGKQCTKHGHGVGVLTLNRTRGRGAGLGTVQVDTAYRPLPERGQPGAQDVRERPRQHVGGYVKGSAEGEAGHQGATVTATVTAT